jgi:hypothetical protein
VVDELPPVGVDRRDGGVFQIGRWLLLDHRLAQRVQRVDRHVDRGRILRGQVLRGVTHQIRKQVVEVGGPDDPEGLALIELRQVGLLGQLAEQDRAHLERLGDVRRTVDDRVPSVLQTSDDSTPWLSRERGVPCCAGRGCIPLM